MDAEHIGSSRKGSVAISPRTRKAPTERREQILREAISIVGQRGYYGFSIQDIADRCDLTVAGVLHHFGTKDNLLVELLADRDRRDEIAVSQYLNADKGGEDSKDGDLPFVVADTIDAVRAVLRGYVVRNSGQPEIVRLYSMLRTESLYEGHPAYAFFRDRDAWVITGVESALEGHVEHPHSSARQVLALMGGLEEQWLRTPDDFDLVQEWDRAIGMILPD